MRRGFSTLAFFRKEVGTGFWARVRSMDTGGDMGSWKAPYNEDDRCVWVMLFPAGRLHGPSD
jgi:hypothetical protein